MHDACVSDGMGPAASAALAAMYAIAHDLSQTNARLLTLEPCGLNYRDLLLAGLPLPLERCDALAQRLAETAYPAAERKKALVVDLDDTLWSGVIGEDGAKAVLCGAEGAGYPFHVFQKFLLKLKDEGALLAFCTKNNPQDILPFFDGLGMPLKLSDFAAYRCNWEPKSANLRELARELNIGTDSLVAIDDNQAELAELRHNIPEAAALGVPREGADWLKLFAKLSDLFGTWRVSREDRLRTASVSAPRPKAPAADQGAGYLRELELKLVLNFDAFSDARSLELINKTNQFNLTGERLTQDEWLAWASAPGAFCVSVKLADRFGDFGVICVAAGRADGEGLYVRQLVLSCRAFGRCVETLVLGALAARSSGPWLRGPFKNTEKNAPASRFLASLGCAAPAQGEWRVDLKTAAETARRAAEESQAAVIMQGGIGARIR